jgi:hypothetical protein
MIFFYIKESKKRRGNFDTSPAYERLCGRVCNKDQGDEDETSCNKSNVTNSNEW